MTKRYDVSQPREYTDRDGAKKTSWQNLGVAFEKDGKISVILNALPMPGADGQAKLILMEPRRQATGSVQGNGGGGYRAPVGDDLDDSVPFITMRGDW